MPPRATPPLVRFYSKFDQSSEGCWLWKDYVPKNGYGLFYNGTKQVGAHVFSYQTAYGQIPDGLCVLHRCDVRHCVRPSHLFLGTYKDNGEDCSQKNRTLHGARNPKAKLTEESVREIREAIAGGRSINWVSRTYAISLKNAQQIKRGDTWERAGGPTFPERMSPSDFAGSKNYQAKITEETVISIRLAHARGQTCKEIAKDVGLSRESIGNIVAKRSWKHVT